MIKPAYKKTLVSSVARSMEAEGFNFNVVKKIVEKKLNAIK